MKGGLTTGVKAGETKWGGLEVGYKICWNAKRKSAVLLVYRGRHETRISWLLIIAQYLPGEDNAVAYLAGIWSGYGSVHPACLMEVQSGDGWAGKSLKRTEVSSGEMGSYTNLECRTPISSLIEYLYLHKLAYKVFLFIL